MFKLFFTIVLLHSLLFAAQHSFTIENDALASHEDGYYTNGLFYNYMDKMEHPSYINFMKDLNTDGAISFTHLMFTPENKKQTTAQFDEIPYAGYAKLNFLLYKSSKNYFHEFGFNIGLVGPSTLAEEFQSNFHSVIGQDKAKGWDTQLKDQFTSGISYQFAYKTDSFDIGNLKADWTNNVRIEAGNYYSGILASSTIRIGSMAYNNFATTGNFTVTDENHLLNNKYPKDFNWSISFGLFANKIANYYIIDEARDLGYTLEELDYISGEQVSYNIFYDEIQYSFTIKSVYLNDHLFTSANKQWGGLTIAWKF